MSSDESHPILLFDGVCNYCNRWVNFILLNDKKGKFRFATLQSAAGKKILKDFNVPEDADSAVIIDCGKAYTKSAVGLRIMKHLGGMYYPLYFLIIVPRIVRDAVYDLVARNRYKWWGKQEVCMVPTEDIKVRFLDHRS